jgi:hypothetical protein
MNLELELDEATAPLTKASDVKRLSPEEIEQLANSGRITPIHVIPKRRPWGPEFEPCMWGLGRGRYEH